MPVLRPLIACLLVAVAIGFSSVSPALAATCNGQTATITGSGTINGTTGNDVIVGSNGPDVINGKGGIDTICSLGGNDKITTTAIRNPVCQCGRRQ